MSRIYERSIHNSLSSYDETILSNFISAYRKSYSSNHVLLRHMAKLHAYGFSEDAVTFVYSYLKRRKQGVKIIDTESVFQVLLSGIPQGSILGTILFNIFINDLFLFIKDVELENFSDDNTIYAARNSVEELMKVLEKESSKSRSVPSNDYEL